MKTQEKYNKMWLSRVLRRERRVIFPLRAAIGSVLMVCLAFFYPEYTSLGLLLIWVLSVLLHWHLSRSASRERITLISQAFIAFDSVMVIFVATVIHELTGPAMLLIPIFMIRAVFSGINPQRYLLQGIPATGMILVLALHVGEALSQVALLLALLWAVAAMVTSLAREQMSLVQRIIRDTQKMEYLANTDSMTGLYNYRYFYSAAQRRIQAGRSFSIIFVDIDDFKNFNETCGHFKGDEVLAKVAGTIKEVQRGDDLVARYGGEEFLILLDGVSGQEAISSAERIRQSVAGLCGVTLSVGVANYPLHGENAEAVIFAADMAMYYAKKSGKNRVAYIENLIDYSLCNCSEVAVARVVSPLMMWLQYRDPDSVEHGRATKEYAAKMAQKLGLTPKDTNTLLVAALLHDLGKGEIPKEILEKPGELSPEEWEIVKRHPLDSVANISQFYQLQEAIEVIRHHHEHFDGSGYPDGLTGEEIPYLARILMVANAFDSMLRAKSYRPAKSRAEALQELRRYAGTQFDPEIVDQFCELFSDPSILRQ